MTTLLTQELSLEAKEKLEGESRDWERFQSLLDLLFDAYVEDEKMTTDKLCLWAVTFAKEFEGEYLPRIPSRGRDRMIGQLIMKAISHRSPDIRATKNYPGTIKRIVFELVNYANQTDGYVKIKTDNIIKNEQLSAFKRVAEILTRVGVEISEASVAKYYEQLNKNKFR